MNKHIAVLLLTAAGLLAALPAQAGGVRERIEHQQMVIERGLETGVLTRHEALKIRREQRELRELAEDLRESGTSRMERQQILDSRLDRIDRPYDNQRNNDRDRFNNNERIDRFNPPDEMPSRSWER